jgi:peptidoglycan/LPS O-acetylase OafA/YrhL
LGAIFRISWLARRRNAFVIFGFIIPYSLHRSQYKLLYFPRFLLRRLVRLEPPYLLHVPIGGRVVNIGRRFVEGPVRELLLSIVALAVSLLAATTFWKYVEEPAKRASKRVALRAPISPLARS